MSKYHDVREIEVDHDSAGQRIDNFLRTRVSDLPKSGLYRIIRTGQVRVNGKRVKPTHKLMTGDRVRVPPIRQEGDGPYQHPASRLQALRQAILFRHDDWLVVNKPSGMAVHSGSGLPWGLIDALQQATDEPGLSLVHRLDRATSGCLLVARSRPAAVQFQQLFQTGAIDKRYLCLLSGVLPDKRMEINQALAPDPDADEKTMQVVQSGGKAAVTEFSELERYADYSYCEARIETGRTHQIRAHAAFLERPLAGDDRYGSKAVNRRLRKAGLKRLFLHAHQLVVPWEGEDMLVHAPLADDLSGVLDRLGKTIPSQKRG